MKNNLEIKWLVAQIKPKSHDLAFRNLQRQGFKTFLPKIKATLKRENKFINKDLLVFPGYMFVGVDVQDSYWTKINSTYGVSKVLVFNNKPSVVPNDFISVLKSKYEENINTIIEKKLKKGDAIKFVNGPFVDLIARIETLDDQNRIWVLLEVMGQHRKVKIQKVENINFTKL